jgi:hypothetical protein
MNDKNIADSRENFGTAGEQSEYCKNNDIRNKFPSSPSPASEGKVMGGLEGCAFDHRELPPCDNCEAEGCEHAPTTPTASERVECCDDVFFEKLETVLDEQFPKFDEECPEKIANRRGAALVLFSYANLFHSKLIAAAEKRGEEKAGIEDRDVYSRAIKIARESAKFCPFCGSEKIERDEELENDIATM